MWTALCQHIYCYLLIDFWAKGGNAKVIRIGTYINKLINFIIRLSISSIDINIIVSTGIYEFKYTEIYYP